MFWGIKMLLVLNDICIKFCVCKRLQWHGKGPSVGSRHFYLPNMSEIAASGLVGCLAWAYTSTALFRSTCKKIFLTSGVVSERGVKAHGEFSSHTQLLSGSAGRRQPLGSQLSLVGSIVRRSVSIHVYEVCVYINLWHLLTVLLWPRKHQMKTSGNIRSLYGDI